MLSFGGGDSISKHICRQEAIVCWFNQFSKVTCNQSKYMTVKDDYDANNENVDGNDDHGKNFFDHFFILIFIEHIE